MNTIPNIINPKPCTCGRSSTGFCTGLHKLSDQEWDSITFDEAFIREQDRRTEDPNNE